jgi:hypothetical protein
VGDLAAYVWGITVDLTGNVFCTGSFWGTVDFNPEKSITFNLKSVNDSYDIFILKLTSSGSYVWVDKLVLLIRSREILFVSMLLPTFILLAITRELSISIQVEVFLTLPLSIQT